MKIEKVDIQQRIFLKGDYNSVEGERVMIDGINYTIGKEVFNPYVERLLPRGAGAEFTGGYVVREAKHPLLANPVHLGIYYYTRLEGEKCAVVEILAK